MAGPVRQLVHEETTPLQMNAGAMDLDNLRKVFSELFDRAMVMVQRAGLDADDVVLERHLLIQIGAGEASWRALPYLSNELFDPSLLTKDALETSLANVLLDVKILAARVSAVADRMS